ncbi:MAG TPA: lysylphosphatidylglycerol synthase domain-containing protein [Solirubrobacteraceae bacterium]|nr:lysylphosphatidylglycerol synthase domain-containing protein [Solirubrobacteraceae bacterium]
MRIALLSPYSWTFPGGVTRHIEALSRELEVAGHETRILAPFDPDDDVARRLHRGARPQRLARPDNLIPLGRTIGIPANGAVSNLSASPAGVLRMRRELAAGRYDVVHIHEPVVPLLAWDALRSTRGPALVGTFHTYSENALTNGIAAGPLGARWRMNRLHARIAVSRAAEWTALRFFGGRYTLVPNGVATARERPRSATEGGPLRILFIGQAVERKGLPVLLRAFEELRGEVDAELVLVGARPEDIEPLVLDGARITALGKVSDERKHDELAAADVVCAPSLGGESFGMVLTEAFAAGAPVVASDIPGYRDVVRQGTDGLLVPPSDPDALAAALRSLALEPARRAAMAASAHLRAERYAWPRVTAEVLDVYEQALAVGEPRTARQRLALRAGVASADLLPAVAPQRLPTLRREQDGAAAGRGRGPRPRGRLAALAVLIALLVTVLARDHVGVGAIAASILSSEPGALLAALGAMCAAVFARSFAWNAILRHAPLELAPGRRITTRATAIGVLMSATLPARLGEPSRAFALARHVGDLRSSMPVVTATIFAQSAINVLALIALALAGASGLHLYDGHHGVLVLLALVPAAAVLAVLFSPAIAERAPMARLDSAQTLARFARSSTVRLREGIALLRSPRTAARAGAFQFAAWALQLTACWFVLRSFGLGAQTGFEGAAAVLFAVNVTALLPATPANVGIFQAACAAVLIGGFHVAPADAIAYGIVLQAVELAVAFGAGMPSLVAEGLTWRSLRRRAMHLDAVQTVPARPLLADR